MRFPVEVVRRTREARRRRLPRSSTGSRCSTWSRAARPGTRSSTSRTRSRRPAPRVINTGIGWHEARVPTIVTHGAARRLALGDGAAARPRSTVPVVRLEPDQHARARRGDPRATATPTWCRWPGRCSPTRTSCQGRRRARRRDQHLHRLQPGLPRPHLRRQARRCLVNPRAGRETELVAASRRREPRSASRSSAPGRPGSRPRRPPPSAATASRSSSRPTRDRRPVPTCASGSRARRSSPRRCATSTHRLEVLGVERRLGTPATPDDLQRLRRGDRRHRRRRAPAGDRGLSHPSVASYADVLGAGGSRGASWRSSAPAASGSTSPNS